MFKKDIKINRIKLKKDGGLDITFIENYFDSVNWTKKSSNLYKDKFYTTYSLLAKEKNNSIFIDIWNESSFGVIISGYTTYFKNQLVVKIINNFIDNLKKYTKERDPSIEIIESYSFKKGRKSYLVDFFIIILAAICGISIVIIFNVFNK